MHSPSPAPHTSHDARHIAHAALSNLFLDTEIADLHSQIVRELSTTPYTVRELDEILAHDVYPVCCWNRWSVAGAWSGIDEDWLSAQIEARRGKRSQFLLRMMGRRFANTDSHWRAVRSELSKTQRTDAI